ncbi:MAG: hypothetical protein ACFFAZ_04435 [Promethearchaeota archaeon]
MANSGIVVIVIVMTYPARITLRGNFGDFTFTAFAEPVEKEMGGIN